MAERRQAQHPGQHLDPYRQPRPGAAQRHPVRHRPARRPTVTTSITRATSQATDSTTARAMSGGLQCAGPRPMNPARASPPPRRPGAVEPGHGHHTAGRGRARRPGPSSFCAGGRAGGRARPGRSRRRTTRPRAASRRQRRGSPPHGGDGTGRSCTGTAPAVVPQLTMGWG